MKIRQSGSLFFIEEKGVKTLVECVVVGVIGASVAYLVVRVMIVWIAG